MSNHHLTTRSTSTNTTTTTISQEFSETMKKTPSPRRQTTRSTSNLPKELASSNSNNDACIQVIKPVAVRPPSSDSSQTPYNLRSRTKLKNSHSHSTEVIPSFTEKLSLETPSTQGKPVPPVTRRAAAAKIDSAVADDANKSNQKQASMSTRSSATRKRKASEDDQRPYLDLLKMKQVIIERVFRQGLAMCVCVCPVDRRGDLYAIESKED